MTTLRKAIRYTSWVWFCLMLPVNLSGCWSYISPEAQDTFQRHSRPFSVTVFPVNVVKGATVEHDEDLALKIVMFLRREKLAEPVPGSTAIDIPVEWGHNQAGMAKKSAFAFASEVKKTAIQTEYALLAEILCNGNETR